jgi:hypothetical protein
MELEEAQAYYLTQVSLLIGQIVEKPFLEVFPNVQTLTFDPNVAEKFAQLGIPSDKVDIVQRWARNMECAKEADWPEFYTDELFNLGAPGKLTEAAAMHIAVVFVNSYVLSHSSLDDMLSLFPHQDTDTCQRILQNARALYATHQDEMEEEKKTHFHQMVVYEFTPEGGMQVKASLPPYDIEKPPSSEEKAEQVIRILCQLGFINSENAEE